MRSRADLPTASLFLLLALLSALGCSTVPGSPAPATALVPPNSSPAEASPLDRIMVYDAELVIEATEPDSLVPRVGRLARSLGGYVLEAGVDAITVRIPSPRLDSALERVATLGEVLDRSLVGQDVTDRYRDLELRLDSARRTRQRYLDLLERSKSVSEALLVEKELERLHREIERMEGQLDRLNEQVRFSTLTVQHRQRVEPGPVGWVFTQIGKGVKWLFVRD